MTAIRSRQLISLCASALLAGAIAPAVAPAAPVTLFFEDFEGYTFAPVAPGGVPAHDAGIPSLAEGAREVWYGAHFAPPNVTNSQSLNDMGVQQPVDYRPADTITGGRLSNEAGVLFRVDTSGHSGATLTFDWTTWYAEPLDTFRFGFHVGGLPFGNCTGNGEAACYADFSGTPDYWANQFTEFGAGQAAPPAPPGGAGKHESFALPIATEIWVAFWMDSSTESASCPNYRCGIAMVDNVEVVATPVPGTFWLMLSGIGLLIGSFHRRTRS